MKYYKKGEDIIASDLDLDLPEATYEEWQQYNLPTKEEIKQQHIAELKAELASTDYMLIKCAEYSFAGEELPYDIADLHAQRQALRDEINQLEE